MKEIIIYGFDECNQCGECCQTPCDIVPSDIPNLLNQFQMSLKEFFEKYLITLIIASPSYPDQILMMVPAKVGYDGQRTTKLIADNEYLSLNGRCIFLNDGKCAIHEHKPFGGKLLQCYKITGSVSIQLAKSQYFAYWARNQHLFEQVVPGYMDVYNQLKIIYQKKNRIFEKHKKVTEEYNRLSHQQDRIISEQLFPLFNGTKPMTGYRVLV